MLSAFAAAFRTPDLRKKLLFTLGLIALYRLGASMPTPGVSTKNINSCINFVNQGSSRNVYSLVNLFSGGALLKLSVFALGIMPYITASIIIQLLVVVIPRFEALKKEGQSGQNKLTQYTRYLTVGLAILQSTGVVALAKNNQLFQGCPQSVLADQSIFTLATMIITMMAGTAVIMWLAELITDRGVGNGMSVLIFTGIAARIPSEGNAILRGAGGVIFFFVCVLGLAIITAVVYVEQAQRRIPVQYAKRMVGRRMYGGTSTYLPLKVNQAGVIPVIFASSLLYIPQLVCQLNGNGTSTIKRFVDELPGQAEQLRLHPGLLRADHLLHVLLRVDHLQPRRTRRRHEEVRRLHPRHPTGTADRRIPVLRALPDHAARIALPGDRGRLTQLLPVDHAGQQPELPLRRHSCAHHGRCRARHRETDREPAACSATTKGSCASEAAPARPQR